MIIIVITIVVLLLIFTEYSLYTRHNFKHYINYLIEQSENFSELGTIIIPILD